MYLAPQSARGFAQHRLTCLSPLPTADAAPAASNERGVSLRLNEFQILKDVKTVEELPDKDYPEWLWTIHVPDPTLADLKKIG